MKQLPLQSRAHNSRSTWNCLLPPLLVVSVLIIELILAMALKKVRGVWAILPNGYLEFARVHILLATSLDTGFDHDNNVVEVYNPYGTGGSLAY